VVDQAGQRRGQQVDLHVLALPGGVAVPQCGQDPDHRVVARHHVEHRDARPVGGTVRVAGEAHQARDRLHHEVVAGHVGPLPGAEAADRGVHHPGVRGAHGSEVQPELREASRLEVLDHHVGAAGELAAQRGVTLVAQVERQRPLPAVDAQVVRGDPVAHRGHPRAGLVAIGPLDLHDLGTHVGQQHRGIGAGEHP
jgi:hypothetical protein